MQISSSFTISAPVSWAPPPDLRVGDLAEGVISPRPAQDQCWSLPGEAAGPRCGRSGCERIGTRQIPGSAPLVRQASCPVAGIDWSCASQFARSYLHVKPVRNQIPLSVMPHVTPGTVLSDWRFLRAVLVQSFAACAGLSVFSPYSELGVDNLRCRLQAETSGKPIRWLKHSRRQTRRMIQVNLTHFAVIVVIRRFCRLFRQGQEGRSWAFPRKRGYKQDGK